MDGKQPTVSIITVCLNSADFLADTIAAVRRQSYPQIEYIVIDGGSTDGSREIIERRADQIDHWVSEPDKGISDAFNKGVKAATGDIIGFLNSQDYYADNTVIQQVVDAFGRNPGTAIVYGRTCYVPVGSTEIVGVMGEPFTEEGMMKRNIIPHQSTFVRKEVFREFGLFKLDYRFVMDYEHLLRATRRHTPLFLDKGLAVMRLGGISDTQKFSVVRELFRAQRENGRTLPASLLTLAYHYWTSAGLRILRIFHIYTLGHLLKKLGFKRRSGPLAL